MNGLFCKRASNRAPSEHFSVLSDEHTCRVAVVELHKPILCSPNKLAAEPNPKYLTAAVKKVAELALGDFRVQLVDVDSAHLRLFTLCGGEDKALEGDVLLQTDVRRINVVNLICLWSWLSGR